jgi:ankyrin repeat protein
MKKLARIMIIVLTISTVLYEGYGQKNVVRDKRVKAQDPFMIFSKGEKNQVKKILDQGFDVNQRHPKYGVTPLFYACENKNPEIVALLLERGALVNTVDSFGETPLRYMIARELVEQDQATALKIIKLLVKAGANVNVKTNVGFTGLIMAIDQRDLELIDVLLEAGADVHDGVNGTNSLHYAAREGLVSVIPRLLQKGALLNNQNFMGETPLFYAAKAGQTEMVKYLISQGANVELADTIGRTPLMAAISEEHCETVQVLIAAGVSVKTRTKRGSAPLLEGGAANNCITKVLIAAGATINIQDEYGLTPLMLAANVGNFIGVKMLLEAGADATIKDNNGKDALFYAKQGKYRTIVKILQQGTKKTSH